MAGPPPPAITCGGDWGIDEAADTLIAAMLVRPSRSLIADGKCGTPFLHDRTRSPSKVAAPRADDHGLAGPRRLARRAGHLACADHLSGRPPVLHRAQAGRRPARARAADRALPGAVDRRHRPVDQRQVRALAVPQ